LVSDGAPREIPGFAARRNTPTQDLFRRRAGQCWKVVGRKQKAGVIELPQRETDAELDRIAARDNILKGSVTDEQPVFPDFEPHAKMLGGPGNQTLAEVVARSILSRVERIERIGVPVSVDVAAQRAEPGAEKWLKF